MIDPIDVRIIDELVANGRISNRALSTTVKLSESACSVRLRQLERSGIILGYSAKVALDRLGVFRSWADVHLVDDGPETIARFERLLMSEPEVLAADVIGTAAHVRILAATSNYERWEHLRWRLLAETEIVQDIDREPILRSCRTRPRLSASLFGPGVAAND